ncbi:MAG: VIT domain-containing protein [Burkholderiaceae bacterium]
MPCWKEFAPTRRSLLASLLAGAAWPALALSTVAIPPGKIAPPLWQPPAVVIQGGGQPIQLKAVQIDTDVFGGQAQTRIEMRLFNPNARVLEGELQFPLLEGQLVTGFALDINGRLRDAVPVPKARGQEIFEDIRRRRVDPSLLEATAGNQYKLRVYPIPARGERRVQLTVTETLPLHRGQAALRVPLVFSSPVGEFTARVRVAGQAPGAVRLVQGPQETQLAQVAGGTEVRVGGRQWSAVASGPSAWLQLAIRQSPAAQVLVGDSGGRRYFSAQVPFKDEPVRRPDPSHVALVWDASASGIEQARAIPVLDAWFRSLRKPVRVSFIVVRNRVEAPRSFTVAGGRWEELLQAIRAEPCDGSSNFDSLPIPQGVDATILVTDGLATDGRRQLNYTHAAPVFAVNAAASADVPRLARLAERTGGAMVDATLLAPADAAHAMLYSGWRIERMSSLTATQLVAPALRLGAGTLAVAGEMAAAVARVEVHLVHADGRRKAVPLDVDGRAAAGRWPAQQWAQWRSRELAENPALHRVQLQEIAAAHGIVGPNSSLLVLEEAADYARFGLPAPPDLVDEVASLRRTQAGAAERQRQAHLEGMVRQFSARQAWWDKDFPKYGRKPEAKTKTEHADMQVAQGENASRRREAQEERARPPMMAGAPAPAMAAPSPAPMPAPAAASRIASADAAKPSAQPGAPRATIALQGWTPNAPYVRRLREAPRAQAYEVYLDERRGNTNSSAFYMDAASLFFERGEVETALRILSNLAEMNLENRQLLRMYGYRLAQAGRNDLAVPVFERVSELAPNEPQSWRDLGLALADSGQPQKAVDALWEVVSQPWHGRFAGAGMIALAELNAIAAKADAAGESLDLSRVDTRLRRNLPLALRVVMAWDTDDTDIDLWVTDPNGEVASYANRLTFQGGAMSPDATGGYGPEEFSLRHAKPGKYAVQAQFYGHTQQVLSGGTTVMVRVTTGFGTPQARDEWMTLRLTSGRETARIGEVDVG